MSDENSKIITVRPDYTLQAVQLDGSEETRNTVREWAGIVGAPPLTGDVLEELEEAHVWFLFRPKAPRAFLMQYPEDFVSFFADVEVEETVPPLTLDEALRDILRDEDKPE